MSLKYLHIYGTVLFTIWLGLFLDSVMLATYISYNQLLSNLLVFMVFVWIFTQVSRVTKKLMLFGLVVAYIGEVSLALGFGMYTYRLENVPLYVPLGHSIVYASVYYITKEPWVRQHKEQIVRLLYPLMIVYSSLWLVFAQDVYGFVSMLIILGLFWRLPETKLFFLVMFFMVVYLELLGTYYQCWHWPSLWFDLSWVPSANPPSGVGVIYFFFDSVCLLCYSFFNRQPWRRLCSMHRYRGNSANWIFN